MDYKEFEKMYGGIPEKTEMDKLINLLKICPPTKYTYSIVELCGRPQIIFMNACTGERVADCICHYGSYGHERGLIEAMGAPLANKEKTWDDVEGCLTAVDIMARICELSLNDIRKIVGEDA
jgi:hypothetical protein|nr:MAG TPA: hypothetical protein [Caudoviricetes sp.]